MLFADYECPPFVAILIILFVIGSILRKLNKTPVGDAAKEAATKKAVSLIGRLFK